MAIPQSGCCRWSADPLQRCSSRSAGAAGAPPMIWNMSPLNEMASTMPMLPKTESEVSGGGWVRKPAKLGCGMKVGL